MPATSLCESAQKECICESDQRENLRCRVNEAEYRSGKVFKPAPAQPRPSPDFGSVQSRSFAPQPRALDFFLLPQFRRFCSFQPEPQERIEGKATLNAEIADLIFSMISMQLLLSSLFAISFYSNIFAIARSGREFYALVRY